MTCPMTEALAWERSALYALCTEPVTGKTGSGTDAGRVGAPSRALPPNFGRGVCLIRRLPGW
jgi:hypothetical protein